MNLVNNYILSAGIPTENLAHDWNADLGRTLNGSNLEGWEDQVGGVNITELTNPPELITNGNPSGDGDCVEFDGVAEWMGKAFTLAEPCTIYAVLRQETSVNNDGLFDGGTNLSGLLQQQTGGAIRYYAGSSAGNNSDLSVGSWGVVAVVAKTTTSTVRVNNNTKTSGNANSNAPEPGGFTFGRVNPSAPANCRFTRVLIYSVEHDDTQQNSVITPLNNIYSVF